jgi:hypothetical protein
VAIRTKAVADVYFSSEAYDDFGPEHGTDSNHTDLQIPDARGWEIIESLAADGVGLEDFEPADVERVRKMIMITSEQYERLVADGTIKAEDLENERAKKVDDKICLVSFMSYDLGYFDHHACRLEPIDNPFKAKVGASIGHCQR